MENPSHTQKRSHERESTDRPESHIKRYKYNDTSQNTFTLVESNEGSGKPLYADGDAAQLITKPHCTASQKVLRLLSALDDILEDDGQQKLDQIFDDSALDKLREVRNSLRKQFQNFDGLSNNFQLKYSPPAQGICELPKSMSGYAVAPWTSSTIPNSLPKLPAVLDRTLEAGSFIHSGCTDGNVNDLNYERLEWIGDAYIEITSTLLISQTFPSFLPGKASQVRERLVKNATLAGYARQYGFEKRAVLPSDLRSSRRDQEMNKVLGDIFEAYVAAIVLSDPKDGVARVSQWLKDLWGMTLRKEILYEESRGTRTDSPLWSLRGDAEPVLKTPASERIVSPKEQLQRAIGGKGIRIEYRDAAPEKKDKNTNLALFTVGVYLDGWGEKGKQLGFGRANGKKEAGMKAAEMAMANKKMMKVFADRKKFHDTQMELERQVLEKQAGGDGP